MRGRKQPEALNTVLFDRYLFRNLGIATLFVAGVLICVVLLTQSMRFLELVVNSGASSGAFWMLALLALPRFLEIILPIAVMAGVVFVYNKMAMDSELIIMRATGASPLALSRPALLLSALVAVVLWITVMWLAPVSLSNMYKLRQVIQTQYSSLLFREGVFNPVGNGLTVYMRERDGGGGLHGLMIHDMRPQNKTPVTILARRGTLLSTPQGQQVVVYEGSRQALDSKTGALNRLDFDKYTIDLPDNAAAASSRWRDPDERTFPELFHPTKEDLLDPANAREFFIEINRRIVSPLLAPGFAVVALACLLLGQTDRRGQGWRIALATGITIAMEGLYLSCLNLSRHSDAGLVILYLLTLLPLLCGIFLLSPAGETFRRRLFFGRKRGRA